MRRGKPELLVATLLAAAPRVVRLVHAQRVEDAPRRCAAIERDVRARLPRLRATRRQARKTQALLDLASSIREQGVPLILTDRKGIRRTHANLPFDAASDSVPNDDPRVARVRRGAGSSSTRRSSIR